MTVTDLYPVSLRLLGRPVLLVGGGATTARRCQGLLDAGAVVTVVAPEASPELRAMAESGLLSWIPREYRREDLAEAWFVQTSTGVPEVDARVARDAEEARVWCVNAADHRESSAWTPAVSRVGDVTIAVNADGDPRRAAALRRGLTAVIESGGLLQYEPSALRRRRSGPGRVALVGGGPGAAGLITVRGRTLLAEADVVVADRLGPRSLLSELDPAVRVIEVGKRPGRHSVAQEEINRILVAEARAGWRVVHLKGGDPYVLGRGGEEAQYCRERGVDVEVVPGVTSAVSVPAAAGIPVTHRGLSRGFTVISAHEDLGTVPDGADHTVVLLMGVARLAEAMVSLGTPRRGPGCPVAIIEEGFGPQQRITIGTLATIVAQAESLGVASPAVVVIGDVVRVSPYARAHFGAESDTGTALDAVRAECGAETEPQTTAYPSRRTKEKL